MSRYKRNYKSVQQMSRSELESTYERQARQARRTVRQLREKYPNIVGLEDFGSDFKTLYKLGDLTDEQLRKEVLFTTNFNKSMFRSPEAYTEWREGLLEEMKRKQYDINEENFDRFARGMKKAKNAGLLNIIPSDLIADYYTADKDPKILKSRMKALTKMLEEGEIDRETAIANVEDWVNNPDKRWQISKKRKSGYDDYY